MNAFVSEKLQVRRRPRHYYHSQSELDHSQLNLPCHSRMPFCSTHARTFTEASTHANRMHDQMQKCEYAKLIVAYFVVSWSSGGWSCTFVFL